MSWTSLTQNYHLILLVTLSWNSYQIRATRTSRIYYFDWVLEYRLHGRGSSWRRTARRLPLHNVSGKKLKKGSHEDLILLVHWLETRRSSATLDLHTELRKVLGLRDENWTINELNKTAPVRPSHRKLLESRFSNGQSCSVGTSCSPFLVRYLYFKIGVSSALSFSLSSSSIQISCLMKKFTKLDDTVELLALSLIIHL